MLRVHAAHDRAPAAHDHRLQPDPIAVMDAGRMVELDHAALLLQRPASLFAQLVAATGAETAAQLTEAAQQAHAAEQGHIKNGAHA